MNGYTIASYSLNGINLLILLSALYTILMRFKKRKSIYDFILMISAFSAILFICNWNIWLHCEPVFTSSSECSQEVESVIFFLAVFLVDLGLYSYVMTSIIR